LKKFQKVFIIGGTGLLGYHATVLFLKKGYQVATISLPEDKPGTGFPKEVDITYGNIFEMSHKELMDMFSGYQALVYAAGPDDRVVPQAPAYDFFYQRLVVTTGKVLAAARDAGVKTCAVLNSYFAYFHRIHPEWQLAEYHAYIRCRIEQADKAIEVGAGKMTVSVLELPYIFGVMPEREALWKEMLFERIKKMPVVMFPKGGTTMITVHQAAEAIVGAIENGTHGTKYPVAGENIDWKQMLRIILDAMGLPKRSIITIPVVFATWYAKNAKRINHKKGLESGLDHGRLMKDIQSRELYIDEDFFTYNALNVSFGGVANAIIDTVRASYPEEMAVKEG
jgi:nucleoside-diphosphate-sugar epimerase